MSEQQTADEIVDRLMVEFYLSPSYNPKASRPADNVNAAIAYAIAAARPMIAAEERERCAAKALSIGEQYGMDETGWFECSETIAAAIRAMGVETHD